MTNSSQNRILIVVCVLHFGTHLYTTFLQPLNHELKEFFHLTLDQDVTRIPSLYLAFYAAANLFSGLLGNRFQSRTVLAFGPFWNGLCVMAMYFLKPENYTAMCVLTVLGAAGGGLYHPVANLLLVKAFPENKGRALGFSGIGACLALIIGPLAANLFVSRQICTWQVICMAYGAMGVACGALAWIYVPQESPNQPVAFEAGRPSTKFSLSNDPEIRRVTVFAILIVLVIATREMANWGTAAITQQFTAIAYPDYIKTNPAFPGLLCGIIFVPGLLIQPLAGKWSDRFGRERVTAGALFCLSASLWLLPIVSREAVVGMYLLLGAATSATVPTVEALIAERAPIRFRSLVYGLVLTAAIGLGSLGPKLVGVIADAGGRSLDAYRNGFWTLSALVFGSSILALFLKPAASILGVDQFHLPAGATALIRRLD